MPAPSQIPTPPSPAARWDEHACAYQDLLLELARIGTNLALRVDALGRDLPILVQVNTFSAVARSVRLCALLAHKISQPLPAKPAQKTPAPTPAAPPQRRDTEPGDPESSDKEPGDKEPGDKEARETEPGDRLEDPSREHNLDRPLPELVKEIKRGLAAGALPGTKLRSATEEAITLALRLAAHDPPPTLNRAARRALAHRPRAHPSG